MQLTRIISVAAFIGIFLWILSQNLSNGLGLVEREPVTPNWTAIASWPSVQVDDLEAQPDPNRRVTMIVLDDSGSMGNGLTDAKAAVVSALKAMDADDRVAVLALNAGTVLPFTTVSHAQSDLFERLRPLRSEGSTPLSRSIGQAQAMLAQEAARARGFGTFRLIVTTDGEADDSNALDAMIEMLASSTPIQLTTIGIGISGGHVLRRQDLGSFVDVANVGALAEALQAAVAENTDFTAITDFSETEG
ncbi:MAG: vWA domain-containing protein [Pseudomonadota bacterium]